VWYQGGKRHLLVDICSVMVIAAVHATNTYDGVGAQWVLQATL
jgi:hypothetical protein